MTTTRTEAIVELFADEAAELARVLELFGEFAAWHGYQGICDLAEIAYGGTHPDRWQWTEDTLTWAGRLALRLKQQTADQAATDTTTNGDAR